MPATHETSQPNRKSNPPSLPRRRDSDKWVLIALAVILLLTIAGFEFLDDEANAIVAATAPAWRLDWCEVTAEGKAGADDRT